MHDLIARLEVAAGPDRELDGAIYIAMDIPAEAAGRIDQTGGLVGWWPKHGAYVSAIEVPAYTASIDAALTLMPDGWRLGILGEWDSETIRTHGPWQAIIMPAGQSDNLGIGLRTRCDHAASPALALCVAALKAHADPP